MARTHRREFRFSNSNTHSNSARAVGYRIRTILAKTRVHHFQNSRNIMLIFDQLPSARFIVDIRILEILQFAFLVCVFSSSHHGVELARISIDYHFFSLLFIHMNTRRNFYLYFINIHRDVT